MPQYSRTQFTCPRVRDRPARPSQASSGPDRQAHAASQSAGMRACRWPHIGRCRGGHERPCVLLILTGGRHMIAGDPGDDHALMARLPGPAGALARDHGPAVRVPPVVRAQRSLIIAAPFAATRDAPSPPRTRHRRRRLLIVCRRSGSRVASRQPDNPPLRIIRV
jgi:hypothetical protein